MGTFEWWLEQIMHHWPNWDAALTIEFVAVLVLAVSVVLLLKRYGKLGQLRPLFLLLLFAHLELVLFALVLGRPSYRGKKHI